MCTRDDVLGFAERIPDSQWAERDIYVFGVYKGESISHFLRELSKRGKSFRRVLGFDSFEGLPSEAAGVALWAGHPRGAFSLREYAKGVDLDAAIGCVRRSLATYPGGDRVELVKGFFDQSLTPGLVHRLDLRPALWVEIDVDLYISTKQLLEFMADHSLIVPGTILYYDDWGGGVAEFTGGESLAHKEWADRYEVKCELLCDTGVRDGIHRQTIFGVNGVRA